MRTTIGGPGAGDLLDPLDEDDVLRRVVVPVLEALLEPGEWDGPAVAWDRDGLLWTCRVVGEHAERYLWEPDVEAPTLGEAAALVVDTVEDVVAESRVRRGEWCWGAVTIPERGNFS